MLDLAVYALLAVFIFSILFRSLGRVSDVNFKIMELGEISKKDNEEIQTSEEEGVETLLFSEMSIEKLKESKLALEEIRSKNKDFLLSRFIHGATSAFEIIQKAFAEKDIKTLSHLLDNELLSFFNKEIERIKK